jgi:catechol 2,3-dioxygenase-like lactoylglutathione lyase family enzyme
MTLARTLSNRTLSTRSLWRASAAMVLSLAALPAVAQDQLWIRQLGTSTLDEALAAASDGSGGVYVGGPTKAGLGGPNAGGTDAWLARYDSAGIQIWVRQLGTSNYETPHAAAPDGWGGVYVGGETNGNLGGPFAGGFGDAWLAHYDSAGNQLWVRQLGTDLDESALAAAPDGSGGVYVSGYTHGSLGGTNAGGADAWLARYDSEGNQLWARQPGTNTGEVAFAAAPDGSGGVYVGGWTSGNLGGPNAGLWDAWLARYDSAAKRLWFRQLGTNADDITFAAAPDGSGGVYVGGWTGGNLGGSNAGSYDAWLARYDSAGNQLWIRQLGTNADDLALAAAPDGSGGVYVSGGTKGSFGGLLAGLIDAWLAHYDSAGNQLWIRQLGTSRGDEAWAAAPAGAGGVYVGGCTGGSLGGPSAGDNDAWLARYDTLCAPISRYCTAKTNSTGCVPSIATSGIPSASTGNGFTISTSKVLDNRFGLYFYSKSGPTNAAFQGGILCVQPPLVRTMLQNSSGTPPCGGSFQIDFNVYVASGKDPGLVAGQQVWIQTWSRDPGFAPPNNTSLSDAVSFTLCQ